MVEESLEKFHTFIKQATGYHVDVKSVHNVHVTATDGSLDALSYAQEAEHEKGHFLKLKEDSKSQYRNARKMSVELSRRLSADEGTCMCVCMRVYVAITIIMTITMTITIIITISITMTNIITI
jgi:hypothetical protein